MTTNVKLGLGIGWRPEIALTIDRRPDLGFVEVIAESIDPDRATPGALANLLSRDVRVTPHGISLSLGGADPLDLSRVKHLARVARLLQAPLVSEHIAFVRAGGVEAGHLLPVARTRAQLDVLVDNVKRAQDLLPVPLALENIAAYFQWPDAEMSEGEFVHEILDRTGARLLLDASNVHANARNFKTSVNAILDAMPIDRIAYVHVGGGVEGEDGLYHDTHAHAVSRESLEIVEAIASRVVIPGAMIERDENFPPPREINAELDALSSAWKRGNLTRERRDN
jgi:uncharacterized protein